MICMKVTFVHISSEDIMSFLFHTVLITTNTCHSISHLSLNSRGKGIPRVSGNEKEKREQGIVKRASLRVRTNLQLSSGRMSSQSLRMILLRWFFSNKIIKHQTLLMIYFFIFLLLLRISDLYEQSINIYSMFIFLSRNYIFTIVDYLQIHFLSILIKQFVQVPKLKGITMLLNCLAESNIDLLLCEFISAFILFHLL